MYSEYNSAEQTSKGCILSLMHMIGSINNSILFSQVLFQNFELFWVNNNMVKVQSGKWDNID